MLIAIIAGLETMVVSPRPGPNRAERGDSSYSWARARTTVLCTLRRQLPQTEDRECYQVPAVHRFETGGSLPARCSNSVVRVRAVTRGPNGHPEASQQAPQHEKEDSSMNLTPSMKGSFFAGIGLWLLLWAALFKADDIAELGGIKRLVNSRPVLPLDPLT